MSAEHPQEAWALCRVPRGQIFALRYTLDAYEGLCITTTLPGRQGLVVARTSRELAEELRQTLEALAGEMPLEVLTWGEGPPPAEPQAADEGSGAWRER